MNLTVKKNTFIKNLQKNTSLTKKITNYEELIKKIKYLAQKEIYDIVSTKDEKKIEERLQKVFGTYMWDYSTPLAALVNRDLIIQVSPNYVKELFDEGLLDFYSEDKIETYTEQNHIDAYRLKQINNVLHAVRATRYRYDINGYFLNEVRRILNISFLSEPQAMHKTSFLTSKPTYVKAISIQDIELTNLQKMDINEDIKRSFNNFKERIRLIHRDIMDDLDKLDLNKILGE